MALALIQLALGLFGLALAAAGFGVFPPLEPVVRRSPRGRAVYVVLAFFATFMIGSGISGLA